MLRLLAICLLAAMTCSAHAILGEKVTAAAASASSTATDPNNHPRYSSSSNVTLNFVTDDGPFGVREYFQVSGGAVFAITWHGKAHPDLSVLLGTYWPEVLQAYANQKRPSRGPDYQYTTNNIVVEKFGQMGNVSGRAYIPTMLPAGLSPEDLQ